MDHVAAEGAPVGTHDLRELAGLGRTRTDHEFAAEDMGGDDVLALDADTWDALRGSRLALVAGHDRTVPAPGQKPFPDFRSFRLVMGRFGTMDVSKP